MTCTIHALLCVNMYTHMCILYLQVYSRYNMQLDTSISACPNRDTGLYFFPEVLTRPLFKPSFYLGLASIKSDWNLHGEQIGLIPSHVLVQQGQSPSQQLLLQPLCACSIPSAGGSMKCTFSRGHHYYSRTPVSHHTSCYIRLVPKAHPSDVEKFQCVTSRPSINSDPASIRTQPLLHKESLI